MTLLHQTRDAIESHLIISEHQFLTMIEKFYSDHKIENFSYFILHYNKVKAFIGLNPHLFYHTIQHTRTVTANILMLGILGNHHTHDIKKALYAALYHDVSYGISTHTRHPLLHETISGSHARLSLYGHPDFKITDIDDIDTAILATARGIAPAFSSAITHKTSHIANLLCDADIAGSCCTSLASCNSLTSLLEDELKVPLQLSEFYQNFLKKTPFISDIGKKILQPIYAENYTRIVA